jgi:hypothetical protein
LPTSSVEAADDIVFTPDGGAYRANVQETGKTNPWPLVPVGVIYWTKGKDTISALYRPDIETVAGESHTDMILVSGEQPFDSSKGKIELYSANVSPGITITDSRTDLKRAGAAGTVLVVAISPQMAPGEYGFNVGIILDGKDYGTVPCKVTVTH